MIPLRSINWNVFKVWIVIVNNFPLNTSRQSIHVYETEYDANKSVKSWAEKNVKAYTVEVPIIQLLNTLTSGGEFYHLEWVYPPTANEVISS